MPSLLDSLGPQLDALEERARALEPTLEDLQREQMRRAQENLDALTGPGAVVVTPPSIGPERKPSPLPWLLAAGVILIVASLSSRRGVR